VFEELGKDHTLKHVDAKEKHDASAPAVDGAKLKENPQKKVLEEVAKAAEKK